MKANVITLLELSISTEQDHLLTGFKKEVSEVESKKHKKKEMDGICQ